MVAVILLKAMVALILLEAVVVSSCSMAIVVLFLFIGHTGSFSIKQPWRLCYCFIAMMAITLLEDVVALFLFNGHSDFIPVEKPW